MKSLWHFFRLIRPMNLLVIALTMAVFQVFLSKYQNRYKPQNYEDYSVYTSFDNQPSIWDSSVFQFDFLLLVLSTVLIAAAGNIINDYFDVKADRINKPELLIIDKHIKRRWAIVFNWAFNSLGLLIGMYLGWKYQNWLLAITPFVSINLLWFYSAFFKRKFFIGNIVVAFLVAIVPVYVLIFYMPLNEIVISVHDAYFVFSYELLIYLVLSIAIVGFIINLIREIVKDIADIEGDMLLGADTIPIRWGIRKSKLMLFALLIPLLLSLMLYVNSAWELDFTLKGGSMGLGNYSPPLLGTNALYFGICSLFVLSLIILSYIVLIISKDRKRYLLSSNLLKIAMFFGLLTPLFL